MPLSFLFLLFIHSTEGFIKSHDETKNKNGLQLQVGDSNVIDIDLVCSFAFLTQAVDFSIYFHFSMYAPLGTASHFKSVIAT